MVKRKFAGICRAVIQPRMILLFLLFMYVHDLKSTVSVTAEMTSQDHRMHLKGLRLRVSKPLDKMLLREYEMGNNAGKPDSESTVEVGPFIGNPEMMLGDTPTIQRRKKNCGMSSVAARAMINPQLKRSYFATTPEEVALKQSEAGREKREAKRSDFLNDGPLPWTCETKLDWKDMGPDHYPRFVRSAECKQRLCFNGLFRCKPRRYRTKVLKRLTGAEAASCEDDDVSLPESLRNNWKLTTVTINLCCDCAGRIPAMGAEPEA